MTQPIFSVIIPLYNKEKYIKRAINSVLNQSFHNFEIIVINDGSTDNSLSVAQSIKDPRIKIYSQQNLGLNNARNAGIMKANGIYVSFLDADDEHTQLFLQHMYKLIKKYKRYSFFATAFKKIEKNGSEINTILGNKQDFIIKDFIGYIAKTGKFFIHVSSVIIRKSIFKKIGYFYTRSIKFHSGTEIVGDFDLWTRISVKYSLVYTNFIGSIYYKNTSVNMLNGYGYQNLYNSFYEDTIKKIIKETSSDQKRKKLTKILYKFFNLMAVQSLIRNNFNEAREYINKQSIRTNEVNKIYKMIEKKELEQKLLSNIKL